MWQKKFKRVESGLILVQVLEEAPAPNISSTFRKSICDAAIAAARAVGYVSAGTGARRVDVIDRRVLN